LEKEGTTSRKTYIMVLGLVGVLSVGSLRVLQAAAFPINAAPMKQAAPIGITDVRGGVRAGGYRAGGVHAGGYRAGGYVYRGGAYGYRAGGYGARAAAAYGNQCGYYPYPPC
jgi:hypothetical protein